MTTTCQDVVNRAVGFSALNAVLTSDVTEMLSRIRADQQRVFTAVAGVTRDRFKVLTSVTSSSGSTGRTISLSALTPPVERVLKVTLGDGRDISPVDELDTDAELSPRYYVRGTSLVEVGGDWGSSGAKTCALVYVYGATTISITGDLTQAVSVPDEWTDILAIPLAAYLFQKDPGRDPAEYDRLANMLDEAQSGFVDYLTNYGGITAQRFVIPNPLRDNRGKK